MKTTDILPVDHLNAVGTAIKKQTNKNYVRYSDTESDLRREYLKYYVYSDGNKAGYSSHKIENNFTILTGDLHPAIQEDIKKNFNSYGYKNISGKTVVDYFNDKKIHLNLKNKRYDFIKSTDGNSVTLIEYFDLESTFEVKPETCFIGVTAFTLHYDENSQSIQYEPVFNTLRQTGLESTEFSDNTVHYLSLKDSRGKSRDLIDDEIDQELFDHGIIPLLSEKKYNKWESLLSAIAPIFYKVIPSDSYDISKDEFERAHQSSLDYDSDIDVYLKRYYLHPITMLAAFIGLPNRCKLGVEPSLENLFWQFLGWEDNKARWVNIALMGPSIIKNLIVVLFTLPGNILRIFTELLPLGAAALCEQGAKLALEQSKVNQNKGSSYIYVSPTWEQASYSWKAAGYAILYRLAQLAGLACDGIYLLGRATTSPIESIRAAWNYQPTFVPSYGTAGVVAVWSIRITLVLFSALLTATIYALLFPLVFKLIPLMGTEVAAIATKVSNALAPIFTSIGNALPQTLMVKLLGMPAAWNGFVWMTTLASIVAAPCKRYIEDCIWWWRQMEIKENVIEDNNPPSNTLDQGAKLLKDLNDTPQTGISPTLQTTVTQTSDLTRNENTAEKNNTKDINLSYVRTTGDTVYSTSMNQPQFQEKDEVSLDSTIESDNNHSM